MGADDAGALGPRIPGRERPLERALRILVVSDVSPVRVEGGAERVLRELATGLAGRGHTVRVVGRAPEGRPAAEPPPGVRVRHVRLTRTSLPRFVAGAVVAARRAVLDELRREPADVLHLHQPLSAFGVLASAAGRRVPSLYTFHSPAADEYRSRSGTTPRHRRGPLGAAGAALLDALERACLARAWRIHVLSEFSASVLRQRHGIGDGSLVRIPGGVDLARFHPAADRAALRRRLGLAPDGPLLLTVRNLEPRMGLDRLLEAMALLGTTHADARLLIGGAGSLRAALEAQARTLGVADRVRFLGFIAEEALPDWYAVADAFVLPTRELEGFGLVTVEALACGTPVLGTRVGATPEILAPLEPAWLFADSGPQGIADGIARFLASIRGGRAERLRAACRRHAETAYGWERAVEAVEAELAALARGVTCLACGAGAMRELFHHRGARYRVCAACGTAAALGRPDSGALRRFYATEYPARYEPPSVSPSRAALARAVVERLGAPGGEARLLDVGCGAGTLLGEAAAAGWASVGIEVGHERCRDARKASGRPAVQADAQAWPVRAGALEAATLVNVLDHLPDPSRALAEARRALAPGGRLAVRVTNGAFHRRASRALAALGGAGRCLGLDGYPVVHLHALTARGLRRLVERAGFRVLAVRNSTLAAGGRGALGLGLVRAGLAGPARLLQALSRGRWLAAPSIELYARREDGP